jgi:hypothetical protein
MSNGGVAMIGRMDLCDPAGEFLISYWIYANSMKLEGLKQLKKHSRFIENKILNF